MSQLQVERRGRVALVTITNPPAGYMDRDTVNELEVVVAELEADDGVGAVVFTGGLPGVFIQHYSVHELGEISGTLREQKLAVDTTQVIPERQLDGIFRRLETMPKATIAAINGNAMGGGFEFTLACDIRLALDGPFSLGLPEINIGILPGAGGTQRLPRIVGTHRALELTLRGRTFGPAEAYRLGIVQELCEGDVVGPAMAMAEEIAAKRSKALAHIKRLVRSANATPLDQGLGMERTLFLDLLVSDDAWDLMSSMNRGERGIRE